MSFGTTTFRPNGSVAMSGANKAGIFIEVVTLGYGNSNKNGSKVYPQVPAGSLFVLIAGAGGQYEYTIGDDGLGHAKLTWAPNSTTSSFFNTTADTVYLVFAKKVNRTDSFGILLNNDDGDQLNDYTYPVPQYVNTVQPPAAPYQSWFTTAGGYQCNEHRFTVSQRPGSNRLLAVYLPDSTDDDAWYSCRPFLGANATSYVNGAYTSNVEMALTVLRHPSVAAAYKVPTIHVFTLDGPISGGGSFSTRYFKPDGTLIYDSSAENITILAQAGMNYLGSSPSPIAIANMPSAPALVIPFLEQDISTSQPPDVNGDDQVRSVYLGMFQRRGNTLYYRFILAHSGTYNSASVGGSFNAQFGVPNGNFFMLLDASQLGAGSVAGQAPPYY